jgi:hypothetical protein
MADHKQILDEVRFAIERRPTPQNWEEADKFHAQLKAEIQAIAERHSVPFQDWGGYEELKNIAVEIDKPKP